MTIFNKMTAEENQNRNDSVDTNLAWNKKRWGQKAGWEEHDKFGYNWSNGNYIHTAANVARIFDRFFRPFTNGRYDLNILEISPGAGRSSVELLRYAEHMTLVDMNQEPLDICAKRLRYYLNDVRFIRNDGISLASVSDKTYDVVASYDSLVHTHPDIVHAYIEQAFNLLNTGGLLWLDHSGRGIKEQGMRSDVSDNQVLAWGLNLGFQVEAQIFRNDWDCISVFRKVVR